MPLKILFIGDVVGSPGRKMVSQMLPRLIHRWGIGLVICNAENAAGGSGLTIRCHEELVEAGVDVFTLGDHVYRKDEVFTLFERDDRLCRPANFPAEAPGAEFALAEARDGTIVGVFSVLGRYLEGRVSAVLGTHTHVATADEQVLPGGTAFIADVGMTGPHGGVIGMDKDAIIKKFLDGLPARFEVASGDVQMNCVLIEADEDAPRNAAGRLRAQKIERLRFRIE